METRWRNKYAQRTKGMGSSVIRELLKYTEQPGIISFAGGLPAPETFPVDEIRQVAQKVLSEHGTQALQYSPTEGYLPLREMIARHTARYGIHVDVDNILLTSGSQQALDLIGKIFINSGDHILTERPTYLGALQAWNSYKADYVSVSMDEEGMRTDEVLEAIRAGAKFIYALPNFQNPSGITMSQRRRDELVKIADQQGIPIVEDDPYGQLRYEGEHLTPLVVQDGLMQERQGYSGNVIYMSTFSKILSPGLRLGWVIAPKTVIRELVMAKQGTDLHTSTLAQMIAYEAAKGGKLDKQIQKIRDIYRVRLHCMLDALERHFPDSVTWTKPEGGLFLWVRLPEWADCREILEQAIEEKVAFVPGGAFYPGGGGWNTMRLNFSYSAPDDIDEGISRLGRVLDRMLSEGVKIGS